MIVIGEFDNIKSPNLVRDLRQAKIYINQYLESEQFIKEMNEHQNFTYTLDHAKKICFSLKGFNAPIILSGYTPPWWKFWARKVNGYTIKNRYPYEIHMNLKNARRMSLVRLSGFLAHEYTHIVGYGHGKNSPSTPGYKQSVPEVFEALVEKYVLEQNS